MILKYNLLIEFTQYTNDINLTEPFQFKLFYR